MLFWSIQVGVMSIILIMVVHHLISYFTKTLTIPKIKDLVTDPIAKYENMLNIIANGQQTTINTVAPTPENEIVNMKNELKNFLKSQINTPSPSYAPSMNNNDTNFTSYS
jgi:hypothetical protein